MLSKFTGQRFVALFFPICSYGLMDKVTDSDSVDVGSIPTRSAKNYKNKRRKI